LGALAVKNNVSIVIHEGDCQLKCNKNLIHRAIFNLVVNAVKYNKLDGRVELSARKENASVIITVRDHGIGISEEEVSNIFEPFYRVGKSRSQEIVGSGLGLSIVKTIIDKHNGTIDVMSVEGAGTTIKVNIPEVMRLDSKSKRLVKGQVIL
jgi:signal transduction histidine kinase